MAFGAEGPAITGLGRRYVMGSPATTVPGRSGGPPEAEATV